MNAATSSKVQLRGIRFQLVKPKDIHVISPTQSNDFSAQHITQEGLLYTSSGALTNFHYTWVELGWYYGASANGFGAYSGGAWARYNASNCQFFYMNFTNGDVKQSSWLKFTIQEITNASGRYTGADYGLIASQISKNGSDIAGIGTETHHQPTALWTHNGDFGIEATCSHYYSGNHAATYDNSAAMSISDRAHSTWYNNWANGVVCPTTMPAGSVKPFCIDWYPRRTGNKLLMSMAGTFTGTRTQVCHNAF